MVDKLPPINLPESALPWAKEIERRLGVTTQGVRQTASKQSTLSAGVGKAADKADQANSVIVEDKRKPTQVGGTLGNYTAYFDNDGVSRAAVKVDWDPVTTADDGSDLPGVQYELWYRNTNEPAEAMRRATLTDQTSGRINNLESTMTYFTQVRAVSPTGVPGDFSVVQAVTTGVALDVPGVPTTPTLSSSLGSVTLTWDGLISGQPMPNWVASVQPMVSTTSGGTYEAVGTPLTKAGSVVLADLPPGSTRYFKLRAVTRTGVYSALSATASIIVAQVDIGDVANLETNLDAAFSAAENAFAEANAARSEAGFATNTATNANAVASNAANSAANATALATNANANAAQAFLDSQNALSNAGIAISYASNADANAANALSNAAAAQANAVNANSNAAAARTQANTAVNTATNAMSNATAARTQANTAANTAANALTNATAANTNAAAALSTATNANANVAVAVSTATNANTNATAALGAATNANSNAAAANSAAALALANATAANTNATAAYAQANTATNVAVNANANASVAVNTATNALANATAANSNAANAAANAINANTNAAAALSTASNANANVAVAVSTAANANTNATAALANATNANATAANANATAANANTNATAAYTQANTAQNTAVNAFANANAAYAAANSAASNAAAAQNAAIAAQVAADTLLAQSPELIVNGGFETTDWWTNTSGAYDTADKHAGAKSMRFTGASEIYSPLFQAVPGRRFRVTYWTNSPGTVTTGGLRITNSALATIGGLSQSFVLSAGWVKNSYDFTMPAGSTEFRVRFATTATQTTMFLDDVSLLDITDAYNAQVAADAAAAAAVAANTRATSAQTAATAANTRATSAQTAAANAHTQANAAFNQANAANTNAATALLSANGKNKTYYATTDPTGTDFVAGDLWYKYTGSLVEGMWRYSGSAWTSLPLGNGSIGSLDAGKIITGFLDVANRIQTNTINGNKLVFNSVFANDVLVLNSVTGPLIQGNAIDGKVITGAIVRTGITNPRVELDSYGFHGYAANAAEVTSVGTDGKFRAIDAEISGVYRSAQSGRRIEIRPAGVNTWDAASFTAKFQDDTLNGPNPGDGGATSYQGSIQFSKDVTTKRSSVYLIGPTFNQINQTDPVTGQNVSGSQRGSGALSFTQSDWLGNGTNAADFDSATAAIDLTSYGSMNLQSDNATSISSQLDAVNIRGWNTVGIYANTGNVTITAAGTSNIIALVSNTRVTGTLNVSSTINAVGALRASTLTAVGNVAGTNVTASANVTGNNINATNNVTANSMYTTGPIGLYINSRPSAVPSLTTAQRGTFFPTPINGDRYFDLNLMSDMCYMVAATGVVVTSGWYPTAGNTYAAGLERNTSLSVPTATLTPIPFNNWTTQPSAGWGGTVNYSAPHLYIPQAGRYLVIGSASIAMGAPVRVLLRLGLYNAGGTEIDFWEAATNGNNGTTVQNLSAILPRIANGQYLRFSIRHDEGVTRTMSVAKMDVTYMGPA